MVNLRSARDSLVVEGGLSEADADAVADVVAEVDEVDVVLLGNCGKDGVGAFGLG